MLPPPPLPVLPPLRGMANGPAADPVGTVSGCAPAKEARLAISPPGLGSPSSDGDAPGDLLASMAREGRGPTLPLRLCACADGGVSSALPLLALWPWWAAGVAGVDVAAAMAASPPAAPAGPGPTTLPSAIRTRLCPAFFAPDRDEPACMLASQPAHSSPSSSAPHSVHRIVAASNSHSSHEGSAIGRQQVSEPDELGQGGRRSAVGAIVEWRSEWLLLL